MSTVVHVLRNIYRQPTMWYGLACGLCLGIGFIVPALWWCSLIGIVGLLRLAQETIPLRSFLYLSWIAWLVKYLCALVWYNSVYPIEWITELSPPVQIAVIGVYWGTSALWLSIGGVVSGYVLYTLYRSKIVPPFIWYVAVPFFWLGGEIAGAVFFSILTMGPGSFVQAYFSFGMVGYLLAETHLGIWLASIGGVWGLTIALVIVATLLRVASHARWRYVGGVVLLGVSCLAFFEVFQGVGTPDTKIGVTVVGIDTSFSEDSLLTDFKMKQRMLELENAMTVALATNATYVLLPEDTRFVTSTYGSISPQVALERFLQTHAETSSVVIDSGRIDTPNGNTYLRATIFDGGNKQVYQFDKQYLVPQGEYVPYLYAAVLRLAGLGTLVDGIEYNSSYRPGPNIQHSGSVPAGFPAILFCFESVRPDGVTALVRAGTDVPFIVHPLSHGWFHQPALLWHQLDTMLIVQSRFSGVPIVSVGNLVSGTLYLPNGQMQSGEVIDSGAEWRVRKFTF